MNRFTYFILLMMSILIYACTEKGSKDNSKDQVNDSTTVVDESAKFNYVADRFADLRVLRYRVPGFEVLTLKEKTLLYYLYEAALAGRDICWDQNCKYNLRVRRTLENIYRSYKGERSGENWDQFMIYTKRVWFSNGIHHHYSSAKLMPGFDETYFRDLVANSDAAGFPVAEDQKPEDLINELVPVIFDPDVLPKRVNKAPDIDKVVNSANNFYEGVTEKEVEDYYAKMPTDDQAPSWGLNSKLMKDNGQVTEHVWKADGMYGAAISEIINWLQKATTVAENEAQKTALEKLIAYYQTGDLKTFDDYSIAWVEDASSKIDVVNGFIEVYGDPLGKKGSYESVVNVRDPEASKRIEAIGNEAQWFEDHSPIMDEHKKANVKGITAKVINVVMESGDASPSTPIGINLPNSNWIRSTVGSKSVNLGNIVDAYDQANKSSGVLEEFCYSQEEIDRAKADAGYSDKLHTDMHEVIGHASGVINPGVGETDETLKNYASTLEEGRADLVALYYLMDQKLIDIGVMPSFETGKAAYDDYIRNGMMLQLRRIEPGENIEEDHMRNRQMVCKWAMELGAKDSVIVKKVRDGKTYFVITDYQKLREIFGRELRELQRIKSEGDFDAGKNLVETYGVIVDKALHQEVLKRFEKLNLAPYSGFINPKLVAIIGDDGSITDVQIVYPESFVEQMMDYADHHSFLPNIN